MGQKYTNMREMYQQVRERVDLSEKIGDPSDMKRLSGELKNASKTHLAQSARVKAHYNEMRKKVSDEVFRKLYNQFHGIFVIIAELKNASETHLKQAKKIDAFNKLKEFGESFISEQPEHEITVGNYTTKFFYMCGSAQKVMSANADKEGAEELTRMQDEFYKLEKEAMDAGEATEEQKETARDLYNKIMSKAGEVGLADEIDDYMKMHIDSMEKGDPKLGFGRTDIKESIQEDGHQDVASAVRQCKIIAEDAMQILQKLQTMSPEDSLPTWWTNKLAVTSNSMNKMRDYLLVPSVSEEVDLLEKLGDLSDIKKLSGELKNASKTHLAQSKRMQAHVDAMRKVKTKDSPFTAYDMEGIVDQLKKASETHSDQARKIDRHLKLPNTTQKFDKDAAKLAKIYRAGLKEVELGEEDGHFMYKDGKKVMVKTKVDHDKYTKMGYTMDEDAKMAKQSDDNLKSMMKKMRDAEKKDPKLPSTQFMIKRIGKEMKKRGLKEMNESKSSSGYDLYHKDFSSAMQHAYGFAKKKYGITIDPKEIDDKVATGPRKPSKGKVNKYRLKGDKGTVQIQVTNLDNKRFELNMYKEEVKMNESLKLDEAVLAGRDYKYDGKGPIKISKKMYAKVSRDSKSMIKGKPYMMALDPKTQATVLAPVKFEELDATVESVVEALSAGDNIREQRRMSPTARAKRDAMRDMDARKKRGDDEVKATDADREKADRNIINKIKKAADVKNEKGSFEIKFDKGPARKVPSRLASLVLQKFNKLKPADKLKFQKQAEKSYSDFLRAVKDMTK
tara:strand:- start:1370 stop:3733 length:2364 start_codon:yes stop_codon:yes gene_type:complete